MTPTTTDPTLLPVSATPVSLPPVEDDDTTFSLVGDWSDIKRWADTAGVWRRLLKFVETLNIQRDSIAIGTILAPLDSPLAIRHLAAWRETEPAASVLHDLALAVRDHPGIFRISTPSPSYEPASSVLHGRLPTLYLYGLLMTKTGSVMSEREQDWIRILHLWLVTHALERKWTVDIHIRKFAGELRLAVLQGGGRLKALLALQHAADDFDSLNLWLAGAGSVRVGEAFRISGRDVEIHRDVVLALKQVALYECGRDTRNSTGNDERHTLLLDVGSPRSEFPNVFRLGTEDDDESGEEFSGDENSSGYAANRPSEKPPSLARQRLTLNGVLLATAEELHCLPFSWGRPSPPERLALQDWITRSLASNSPVRATLAAMVWIAIHAGRSLTRALEIRVNADVHKEWTFIPTASALRRFPPLRQNGWVPKPGSAEQAWVLPIANWNELPVQPAVNAILTERLAEQPSAQYLADLWNPEWPERPELAFRHAMKGMTARITPGMLGGVLPQETQERFGDLAFARLISAHPQSGLPGSCAYAGWNDEAVTKALAPLSAQDSFLPQDRVTAIGSRLAPIEALLAASIRNARQRVDTLRSAGDPIAFHNAWTAYHAMSFLAATGARPVRDVFESIQHFDLTGRFVFVEDKASSDIRQGRPIPLPEQLISFLQTEYSRHLTQLASIVAPAHPKLAAEILATAAGHASALPPFFFLATRPVLGWDSASGETISHLELFDWDLPANLFRHRLARVLRLKGVDAEIIDGLLGHAEMGSVTYGDYSPRTWADDMVRARPAIEQAFAELDFAPVPTWDSEPSPLPPCQGTEPPLDRSRLFGRKAREKERRKKIAAALRDARQTITNFLVETRIAGKKDGEPASSGGKPSGVNEGGRKPNAADSLAFSAQLAELDKDQMDDLSRRLLFRKNGLPHPRGGLMYRYFMTRLAWAKHAAGKQLRLKRQFMRMESESSPFTSLVVGASDLHATLAREMTAVLAQTMPSRASLAERAMLAASVLCLHYRVTNQSLLKDILSGQNFRLVKLDDAIHFEYGLGIARDNTRPARFRRAIGYHLAALLDDLLTRSYKLSIGDSPLTSPLSSLATIMGDWGAGRAGTLTNVQFVTDLALITDQANVLALPGLLAGYLADRVNSTPLGWHDWVRASTGKHIAIPSGEISSEDGGQTITSRVVPATNNEPGMQTAAIDFFKKLRKLLDEEDAGNTAETATLNRGKLARKIDAEISRHAVSETVAMLGQWLVFLLAAHRSKSHQTHKKLSKPTLQRYLGALSQPFEECGHDVNLVSLDDDGITDFYGNVLDAANADNLDYVKQRLLDFHRFARSRGVEEPNWSELDVGKSDYPVSPGFISEEEYQSALATMLGSTVEEPRRLAAAFLLVLAYRFGLRSGEAHGLLRSDWLEFGNWIVVLVRRNRLRGLKAPSSRRLVPLLFPLSAQERFVIERILADAEARGGADKVAPLLGDPLQKSDPIPIETIKAHVVATLRQVTANPLLTLHHARHATGNRCALAIFDLSLPNWPSEADAGRIPKCLLATQAQTRRRTWAVGRFMGHASPRTTLRSYLHFLGDWAASLIPSPTLSGKQYPLRNVVDLDTFPDNPPVSASPTATTLARKPLPADLLRFLRLVTRGKKPSVAAASLGLEAALCLSALETLRTASGRSKLPPLKRGAAEATSGTDIEFLARISESAWNRLIPFLEWCDREGDPSSETATAKLPSQDGLANMIGPRGHIVLAEEPEFQLLARVMHYLKLTSADYMAIQSQESKRLKALSDAYGIPLCTPEAPRKERAAAVEARKSLKMKEGKTEGEHKDKGTSILYPDPAFDTVGEPDYRTRCAVTCNENPSRPIRRTVQLVLLFVVTASCFCSL